MSSSATGVGMPICFLGAILLILTQKSSQKFGDVLGIGNSTEAVILVNVLYELLAVVLTQGLHVPWDALSYLSSCDGRLVNHLVQVSANTDEHLVC